MVAETTPLLNLTAIDLMSRDVVVIPVEWSLRSAAHLLSRANVTGAPVVDAAGHCVGVLSATDFMRWTDRHELPARPTRAGPPTFCSDWQVPAPENLPPEGVAAYMTADPVTVLPDTSIRDLTRNMLDAHIHRVIVVSPEGRPVGIVTSTDILAAVARAEMD
jgi:CBS-domain-containing membrane protein